MKASSFILGNKPTVPGQKNKCSQLSAVHHCESPDSAEMFMNLPKYTTLPTVNIFIISVFCREALQLQILFLESEHAHSSTPPLFNVVHQSFYAISFGNESLFFFFFSFFLFSFFSFFLSSLLVFLLLQKLYIFSEQQYMAL